MGKTYRRKPSSSTYFRKPSYIGVRREEQEVKEMVEEGLPIKHANRNRTADVRTIEDWDDEIVSTYRGQEWHRENKDDNKD